MNDEPFKEFLTGVQTACSDSACALVGGETAEMPGIYQKNDFDCAGFVVGIVDRPDILGPSKVQKGDALLALPSTGFHSNGYSLLRKVFEQDMDHWAETLLKPTALYVKICHALKGRVHALAHITGGGLDNILRVLPQGSQAVFQPWPLPQSFLEVQKRTGMSWQKMLKTFNCGVGMAVVCSPHLYGSLVEDLKKMNVQAFKLGEVEDISPHSASRWTMDFSAWEKL